MHKIDFGALSAAVVCSVVLTMPASAVTSVPLKVLPLNVGISKVSKSRVVEKGMAEEATKMLRHDVAQLPAYVLAEEVSNEKNLPKSDKLPPAKKEYPEQSPLKTPVCVVTGSINFTHPKGDSNNIDGAELDMRVVDLKSNEVIDVIHAMKKLPSPQPLPDEGAIHKADFESTPTGQMLHSLVAQSVTKLDAMANDQTGSLSKFLQKKSKGSK